MITAAVGALITLLGTQAQQMVSLHGKAIDNSAYPGGHWPDPTAGDFRNSSVQGGTAPWSYAG